MLATLLPFLAAALAPVDTIHVGDPSVLTTLSAGVETVDNYVMRDGEKQLVATFIQTVIEIPDGYLIVQENQRSSGATLSLDSIVVTDGTLATRWHGDVTPDGRRHVVFSRGRMTGLALDTLSHETPIDVEVPDRLFDYSIMTLVADRLPLSVGYRATVAAYDITRGAVYVPIEIVGAESINLSGTPFDAWRMEVDLGQQTVTRWVERGTARELRWSVTINGREMIGERRPG